MILLNLLFLLHVHTTKSLALPDSLEIKAIDLEDQDKIWLLANRTGETTRSVWLWHPRDHELERFKISGKLLISVLAANSKVAVTSGLNTKSVYLLNPENDRVDTVHLDTTGCSKYTPILAIPLPDNRVVVYTVRNINGYPELLHFYHTEGGYAGSAMPMDVYPHEAGVDAFFFLSRQIDALGNRVYAISNYSPFVFVYDTAGKLLRRFGETPEGYRVALPLAPDISFNPEFSREHGRLILDSSDVYQRIYASSDMIFACFSRGKERITQVYDTAGNYIGILDFWPDAVDTSGNIYSLEGRVIRVIKLKK